jgi:putative endonuclease
MNSWYTYIVLCADGTYYTGVTTDINRRISEHNAGVGSKYTRSRTPVKLVWKDCHPDRSSAQKEEYRVKRLSHEDKRIMAESYCNEDNRTYAGYNPASWI